MTLPAELKNGESADHVRSVDSFPLDHEVGMRNEGKIKQNTPIVVMEDSNMEFKLYSADAASVDEVDEITSFSSRDGLMNSSHIFSI